MKTILHYVLSVFVYAAAYCLIGALLLGYQARYNVTFLSPVGLLSAVFGVPLMTPLYYLSQYDGAALMFVVDSWPFLFWANMTVWAVGITSCVSVIRRKKAANKRRQDTLRAPAA